MKNGKRPTRRQKIMLSNAGLNPSYWLIVKNKPDGEVVIVHKHNRIIIALGTPPAGQ